MILDSSERRIPTPTTIPAFRSPDEKELSDFLTERGLKINPLRPSPLPVVKVPDDDE